MPEPIDIPEPPESWVTSLAKSKIQLAAGDTLPLEPVLQRLRASAERMETRVARAKTRSA